MFHISTSLIDTPVLYLRAPTRLVGTPRGSCPGIHGYTITSSPDFRFTGSSRFVRLVIWNLLRCQSLSI